MSAENETTNATSATPGATPPPDAKTPDPENATASEPACACSVIIPVHNEEANLPELLANLIDVENSLPKPCEFIFINDGSNDNSASFLANSSLRNAWISPGGYNFNILINNKNGVSLRRRGILSRRRVFIQLFQVVKRGVWRRRVMPFFCAFSRFFNGCPADRDGGRKAGIWGKEFTPGMGKAGLWGRKRVYAAPASGRGDNAKAPASGRGDNAKAPGLARIM